MKVDWNLIAAVAEAVAVVDYLETRKKDKSTSQDSSSEMEK